MTAGHPYTLDRYERILDGLAEHGYQTPGFDGADTVDAGELLLRHDVDLSPRKARTIAELEADRDLTATFFFLVTSPLYNLHHEPTRRQIRAIESMGHTVGLHFDPREYWSERPDPAELTRRIDAERRALSAVADSPTDVVAFHIPPDWVLGEALPEIRSTYEPRYFDAIAYRSDSNQRWREERPFTGGYPERLQLLTHPGLWGPQDGSFIERFATARDRRIADVEVTIESTYDIELPERRVPRAGK